MKKIWKYFVVFVVANLIKQSDCSAQFTYEQTYTIPPGGEAVFVTNIGNNNYKYVMIDYYANRFSLFNLDHTPFMTNIQLPLATDSFASYQVGYITSTLFDCDSTNIEYALMPSGADSRTFMVYRTDGTLLFSKDSTTVQYGYGYNVGSVEIRGIENTPAGAKLFLFNQQREIFVYGLCGTLPNEIKTINQSSSYVRLYPNPTSNKINFEVSAPNNHDVFELTIFDLAFQVIKTIIISGDKAQINFEEENLSSGSYFYSLQNKHEVFQTGKFLLTK